MIRIVVTKELRNKIFKIFKRESKKVYKLLFSLKENPNKGKLLATIGTMHLKELRYKSFRLFFIMNRNELHLFNEKKFKELLIKFISMSKKNNQQKTIDEIRQVLEKIREEEFR